MSGLVRVRELLAASLAVFVLGAGVYAPPASASPARSVLAAPGDDQPGSTVKVPVPPVVTEPWNGQTGMAVTIDERWRKAVADVAEFAEEVELRDAALAALAAGDPAAIKRFAMVEKRQLETQILARQRQTAADNLAKVKALQGTGGPMFNAEATRVLTGTDYDREAFLAYGADIARERDGQAGKADQERAAQLRERLKILAAAAAPESQVKQAADQALAGDDAAVAAFFDAGYLVAANADAAAREEYLKKLEERNRAAEELSDLAKRAARASDARRRLLAAHGDGVRALQRSANAMASAANTARHSTRVLAGGKSTEDKAAELAAANAEARRQVGYAGQAAEHAGVAAALAVAAADTLKETGLTYGAEWAGMAQGMSLAATAAVGAAQTAQHAIDATVATNAAQGAQARAEAHKQQAEQWKKHADEHAKAAKELAAAAARQAQAAKTAAERTKVAREKAQAAERQAQAAAERTRQHRKTAEQEAEKAEAARKDAERERANAARHRAEAEKQASIARNARANAEAQGRLAADARGRSEASEDVAAKAEETAEGGERRAKKAREDAEAAERAEQTAKAEAQAKRAWAAQADSAEAKKKAQGAADEADRQAGIAGGAARSARAHAHTATAAAAKSRAAATEANRAADRAWAAARKAEAAARAADAAADKAESEAKATHAARVRADAQAAVAVAQQVKAAEAANAAVRIAEQAADEAVKALWAADRTREEAEAATNEAVAASAQADIAVSAASAARASAAGIAEPANTALAMVSPFTGADIDADFVAQVAEQAKIIGAEQSAAARARAAEALTAAQKASEAAKEANDQVRPAYLAAADAAKSAADAAGSAAEAKQAAAQAAIESAAARIAAAGAAKADAQARADAIGARKAANEAANDARIAKRNAVEAQQDADRANNAASAAEKDAAAARSAATKAEKDAAAAREAADSAQEHADNAAKAADNALEHAIAAQKAFERAEEADRKRANEALANDVTGPPGPATDKDLLDSLTPEEQEELRRALAEAGMSIWDFFKNNSRQLFEDLTGIGDIKSCILDGNVVACIWALVGLLPFGKMLNAVGDMVKLVPKLLKFLDMVKAARKKADELLEKAREKLKLKGCKGSGKPRLAAPSRFADGTNSGKSTQTTFIRLGKKQGVGAQALGGSGAARASQADDPPIPCFGAAGITAGSNLSRFKKHYLDHRALLEKALGKTYPKWKGDEGAEFLNDLHEMVKSGKLKYNGLGTLAKDQPAGHVFRGEGVTLVLRTNGEFWTLLTTGAGKDLAIVMVK
ncbi:MAG TPA: hypothetical protein VF755_01105 [Catenuloplanes sp.]